MKLVVQRVSRGSVSVKNKTIGSINRGFVVMVGLKGGDTENTVDKLAQKLINLRIMSDQQERMNKSLEDVGGEILLISQFTLYADTKGRRPGFTKAMCPKDAKNLFNYFVDQVKKSGLKIETGEFGTMMQVEIINDGPVTIILEEN
ncbi:D-aminoacyl-tRNA deacylase [Patescibacteria group bacterium]